MNNIYYDNIFNLIPKKQKEFNKKLIAFCSDIEFLQNVYAPHSFLREAYIVKSYKEKKHNILLSKLPKGIVEKHHDFYINLDLLKKFMTQTIKIDNNDITFKLNPDPDKESSILLKFKDIYLKIYFNRINIGINNNAYFSCISPKNSSIYSYFNGSDEKIVSDYKIYDFISNNIHLKESEIKDFLKLTYDLNEHSDIYKYLISPLIILNKIISKSKVKTTQKLNIKNTF